MGMSWHDVYQQAIDYVSFIKSTNNWNTLELQFDLQ
jgi:hypothetical protein